MLACRCLFCSFAGSCRSARFPSPTLLVQQHESNHLRFAYFSEYCIIHVPVQVWRTWLADTGLTVEERSSLEAAGLRALTLHTWCLQAKQLAGAPLCDRRLWRSQLQQTLQASFALKPGAAIALVGALETHASRLTTYPRPAEQQFFREDGAR
jgi:hypothetical protein